MRHSLKNLKRDGPINWRASSDDAEIIFVIGRLRPSTLLIELAPLKGQLAASISFDCGTGDWSETLGLPYAQARGYLFDLNALPRIEQIKIRPMTREPFRYHAKSFYHSWFVERYLRRQTIRAARSGRTVPSFLLVTPHVGTRPFAITTWKTRVHFAHVTNLARSTQRLTVHPLTTPAQITISLVVPVYNTPISFLDDLIRSVDAQGCVGAELVLCDDGSTDAATTAYLKRLANPAVTVVFHATNTGIASATNRGIAAARGRWIALVDHDDALAPYALQRVLDAMRQFPDAKMFYTDEVVTDGRLRPAHYILKPAFDPVLLTGVNYLNHLCLYLRDRLMSLGCLRDGFQGSQDYDLVLRYTRRLAPEEIVHVPYPAYLWRRTKGAYSARFLSHATASARRALIDHFASSVGPISIEDALGSPLHRPRLDHELKSWPPLAVVIPSKDALPLISQILTDLRDRTDYPDLQIIVADNGTTDTAVLDFYQSFSQSHPRFRVLREEHAFNFSRQVNRGVRHAGNRHVLILNNDVKVTSADWLKEMVSCLRLPGAGIVGAMLLYPDQSIQHAGVIVGFGGYAGHWFERKSQDFPGPFGRLKVRQCVSAVTAACMLVSRQCIEKVGELDEMAFAVAYNDVDFCLRAIAAQFRVIWTPFARLEHVGSATRGSDETSANRKRFGREKLALEARHATSRFEDPAINPWYSRDRADPVLLLSDRLPGPRSGRLTETPVHD